MRPLVSEMRWAFSWEAVVVGVGIFAIWVGLDPFYPTQIHWVESIGLRTWKSGRTVILGEQFGRARVVFHRHADSGFDFGRAAAGGSFLPLVFVSLHRAGQNFLSVPLNQFLPLPFLATAAVFGFSHNEWLAGIFCGAAYQWLVLRKNRLGDAMTAHAITNFLLGVWVVWQGAWNFW